MSDPQCVVNQHKSVYHLDLDTLIKNITAVNQQMCKSKIFSCCYAISRGSANKHRLNIKIEMSQI
jgi:hypothetical protein